MSSIFLPAIWNNEGWSGDLSVIQVEGHFKKTWENKAWICCAFTLPRTNSKFAPKNRLKKERRKSSKHLFSGTMLVLGGVLGCLFISFSHSIFPVIMFVEALHKWITNDLQNSWKVRSFQNSGESDFYSLLGSGCFFKRIKHTRACCQSTAQSLSTSRRFHVIFKFEVEKPETWVRWRLFDVFLGFERVGCHQLASLASMWKMP